MTNEGGEIPTNKPEGISTELSQIKNRLEGAKLFRGLLGQDPTEVPDALADATRFARSEQLVSTENLHEVHEKITKIRDIVTAKNKDLTTHPDVDDWIDGGLRTAEDAKNFFWDRRPGFEVMMDKFVPENDEEASGIRLGITARQLDQGYEAEVEFDFKNRFALELTFHDPADPKEILVYNASDELKLLDWQSMTTEEFKIINHQFDRYLKASEEPEQHDENK